MWLLLSLPHPVSCGRAAPSWPGRAHGNRFTRAQDETTQVAGAAAAGGRGAGAAMGACTATATQANPASATAAAATRNGRAGPPLVKRIAAPPTPTSTAATLGTSRLRYKPTASR